MKWFFGVIILILWISAISFLVSLGSEVNIYFFLLFLILIFSVSLLWHAAYFKKEIDKAKSLVVSHALIILSFGGFAIGVGVQSISEGNCNSHDASTTGSSMLSRLFDYLESMGLCFEVAVAQIIIGIILCISSIKLIFGLIFQKATS